MEKPLLVLRGGASALFMAPYSTRGPAGASRARRASRDERQRLRSERARGDWKKRSEGLRRTPPRPAPEALRGGVCRPGHPGSTGCPLFIGR